MSINRATFTKQAALKAMKLKQERFIREKAKLFHDGLYAELISYADKEELSLSFSDIHSRDFFKRCLTEAIVGPIVQLVEVYGLTAAIVVAERFEKVSSTSGQNVIDIVQTIINRFSNPAPLTTNNDDDDSYDQIRNIQLLQLYLGKLVNIFSGNYSLFNQFNLVTPDTLTQTGQVEVSKAVAEFSTAFLARIIARLLDLAREQNIDLVKERAHYVESESRPTRVMTGWQRELSYYAQVMNDTKLAAKYAAETFAVYHDELVNYNPSITRSGQYTSWLRNTVQLSTTIPSILLDAEEKRRNKGRPVTSFLLNNRHPISDNSEQGIIARRLASLYRDAEIYNRYRISILKCARDSNRELSFNSYLYFQHDYKKLINHLCAEEIDRFHVNREQVEIVLYLSMNNFAEARKTQQTCFVPWLYASVAFDKLRSFHGVLAKYLSNAPNWAAVSNFIKQSECDMLRSRATPNIAALDQLSRDQQCVLFDIVLTCLVNRPQYAKEQEYGGYNDKPDYDNNSFINNLIAFQASCSDLNFFQQLSQCHKQGKLNFTALFYVFVCKPQDNFASLKQFLSSYTPDDVHLGIDYLHRHEDWLKRLDEPTLIKQRLFIYSKCTSAAQRDYARALPRGVITRLYETEGMQQPGTQFASSEGSLTRRIVLSAPLYEHVVTLVSDKSTSCRQHFPAVQQLDVINRGQGSHLTKLQDIVILRNAPLTDDNIALLTSDSFSQAYETNFFDAKFIAGASLIDLKRYSDTFKKAQQLGIKSARDSRCLDLLDLDMEDLRNRFLKQN